MLIYTLRIKRKEIRENQIKYARTLLTCINEEGASAALMTKDLRLLRESGIKNAVQERLITVAYTTSTCVHLHIGIFFLWDKERDRVRAECFASSAVFTRECDHMTYISLKHSRTELKATTVNPMHTSENI